MEQSFTEIGKTTGGAVWGWGRNQEFAHPVALLWRPSLIPGIVPGIQ